MFDDDNEMWAHSEIMREFVKHYVEPEMLRNSSLEQTNDFVLDGDVATDEAVVAEINGPDIFKNAEFDEVSFSIEQLQKLAKQAQSYNNEKVVYLIEHTINKLQSLKDEE